MDRLGFSGGSGDRATILITDTGSGIRVEVDMSHAPHAVEAEESAVEAAMDIMLRSIGRPEWKAAIVPSAEAC